MKTKQLKANDPLTGKLLSYSAAATAILAIGQQAEAQVAYTDVDPDESFTGEVGDKGIYELDINNDGTVDLQIIHGNDDWYSGWQSVRVLPQNQGGVVTGAIYFTAWEKSYYMGLMFEKDAVIGPDEGFNSSEDYGSVQMAWQGTSYSIAYTSGPWVGETDKYLGVRFSLDDGTTFHYGWVRLDVAADMTSFTVKDYAYEETADQFIRAGHTVAGIDNGLSNDFGVKVFSFEKSVIISDLSDDNAHAEIYNALGQRVHSSPVRSGRTAIPMADAGLYIVKLKVNDDLITSKVIVR